MEITPSELENITKPEQPPGHFDPTDELPEEIVEQCRAKVEDNLRETNSIELNLEKSEIKVPGQEWILVSFVGENLEQKTTELGMKVWGCFEDIKTAKEHADKLNKHVDNKYFDIFILEMYTWAMIPPQKKYITDQNYHEEKLHEIITERKRQQDLAKEVFEARKEKLMSNPDKNEYAKNKLEIKELMDNPPQRPTDVGGELHKKVFGEPETLPKMEILDETGEVLSESQGLSETDEEYKERMKTFKQKLETVEESIGVDTEHAEKFYDK